MISTKKLIKMAKKWQKLAAASRKRISFPMINSSSRSQVADKGHFVVYTSDEKRFALPLMYLESEIFRQLLIMAEDEFGLVSDGPLTLPCDSMFMDYVISIIQRSVATELVEALLLSLSDCHSSFTSVSSEHLNHTHMLVSCC